ncbi:recombinase [Vibrio phage JSF12]|uniref:Recombinase n=2 Tax=Jesfedecavirus TaxID=2560156 RepID=A0A2D0Z1I9_9CAUD|nr:recombinase [Vibrio phage JSF10]YP_009794811.1 recombinase [Vibrio phage JSF12]ASV43453.1 recombinase [Vibrio phage JSF10]ASV43646.1 recombinase [Vibrio phage JSF12]
MELNKIFEDNQCSEHIIGGDIFDRFDPTPEEIRLYFDLLALINHPTKIYTGNHEMVSKSKHVLETLAAETRRCNPLVEVITEPYRSVDYDIVDYKELHQNRWSDRVSRLCFTHVRGEIPPHVKPEIDLSVFDEYSLVIAGDLHSHQNSQVTPAGTPIIYPGSPLTTSFHRERTLKTNGALIVDTKTLEYSWEDLSSLPQLIRKTVKVGEELVEDPYDRVIYEVEGDIVDLKTVANNPLLDKKVNKNVGKPAILDLTNTSGVTEELSLYLKNVLNLPQGTVKSLVDRFKREIPNAS